MSNQIKSKQKIVTLSRTDQDRRIYYVEHMHFLQTTKFALLNIFLLSIHIQISIQTSKSSHLDSLSATKANDDTSCGVMWSFRLSAPFIPDKIVLSQLEWRSENFAGNAIPFVSVLYYYDLSFRICFY
jgi:hypothetical protein